MRIDNVIMGGIKGVESRAVVPLNGLDIFVGPNGAGKTTVVDAVRVGMQGYLSKEHGMKPQATMKLANCDNMELGFEANGVSMTRNFTRKGTKIEQTVFIDGQKRAYTEGDGMIKSAVGDFPVMLDVALFEKMSDNQKRDFIFQLSSGMEEISDRASFMESVKISFFRSFIGDAVDLILKHAYDGSTYEDLSGAKKIELTNKLLHELTEPQKEHLGLILSSFDERFSSDRQQMFDNMREILKDDLQFLKAKIKDTESTQRRLAEIETQTDDVEGAETDARTKIGELEKAVEEKSGELKVNNQLIEQISDHNENLKSIQDAIQEDEDWLENEFLSFEEHIEKRNSAESLGIELAELLGQRKSSREELVKASDDNYAITRPLVAERAILKDALKTIDDNSGTCVIMKELSLPCGQDMSESIQKINDRLVEINSVVGPTETEQQRILEDIQKLDEQIKETDAQLTSAKQDFADNKTIVSQMEARRETISKTLDGRKARLEELNKKKLKEPQDSSIMEGQLEQLRGSLTNARSRLENIQTTRATIQALSGSVLQGKAAVEKQEVTKHLQQTIKNMRDEMLSEVVGPISSMVNKLMRNMYPDISVWFNLDRGFEIKVTRGEKDIPFETQSGGEKIVFYIALLAAIVEMADPEVKFLGLECSELDFAKLQIVLDSMPKLATNIDNVIALFPFEATKKINSIHDAIDFPVEWTLHDLSEKSHGEA